MSQNVPGSPVIKMCSKHNETLLRTLHAEVRILAVYAKYVAMPTKSKSQMVAKRWKESSSRRFDGKERKDKRVYRSLVHEIEERSVWRVFFCAAAVLAYLQLWQRLRIMDDQC